MIRFFCTTCQKQKRVRKLPPSVTAIRDAVTDRITGYTPGVCRFHSATVSRAEVNDRTHIGKHLGSTRKISSSSAKTKSKKG